MGNPALITGKKEDNEKEDGNERKGDKDDKEEFETQEAEAEIDSEQEGDRRVVKLNEN